MRPSRAQRRTVTGCRPTFFAACEIVIEVDSVMSDFDHK